jgi:hypothetical protein
MQILLGWSTNWLNSALFHLFVHAQTQCFCTLDWFWFYHHYICNNMYTVSC